MDSCEQPDLSMQSSMEPDAAHAQEVSKLEEKKISTPSKLNTEYDNYEGGIIQDLFDGIDL